STAARTPRSGADGVVGCLATLISPVAASCRTRSVKVPPTSTPMTVVMPGNVDAAAHRVDVSSRRRDRRCCLRETVVVEHHVTGELEREAGLRVGQVGVERLRDAPDP